ncbi:MAG: hypothetical protein HZA92_04215 [Verrucomicrobia bacterium]|nr:hypothetical protein [Verrucomicrobiota bacterium]
MPAPLPADSFAAGAFHPDYGTRRVSGTLRIDGGMVNFAGEQGFFAFPLGTVQVSLGGAGDRLVFFEHASYPKASMFTTEQSILSHPAFAQNPALTRARDRIRRRKLVGRCIIVAALTAVLAGVWLALRVTW